MPSHDVPSAILLAGSVLLLTVLWSVLARRQSAGARDARDQPLPSEKGLTGVLLRLLCALLCGIGALLLLPWASVLPRAGGSGLLLGLLFLALLGGGALYAVRSGEDGES